MKKYITDKEEPIFDIRNTFPEIIDEIEITGDLTKIINEEQFDYLRKTWRVTEFGYDGVMYIKLQNLFTIDDVKNKIEEICKESKGE